MLFSFREIKIIAQFLMALFRYIVERSLFDTLACLKKVFHVWWRIKKKKIRIIIASNNLERKGK